MNNLSAPSADNDQTRQSCCFLLSYNHWIRNLWDVIIILGTLYLAFIVPYEVTFMSQDVMKRPTLVADIFIELLFVLDIALNFRTTYKTDEGEVRDPHAIAMHYVKSYFFIDLVAALPIDLLHFVTKVSPAVHLLKTMRLLRLVRLIQKLEKYAHNSLLVLVCLMTGFGLLAHWSACMWYVIGLHDLKTARWHVGWLSELADRQETPYSDNRTTGGPSEASAYVGAVYFTLTSITTVGFGNISPNTNSEKLFTICLMFIGALMHALIFGNVSAIINRIYMRRSENHTRLNVFNRFILENDIPHELAERLQEYAHSSKTNSIRRPPASTPQSRFISKFRAGLYSLSGRAQDLLAPAPQVSAPVPPVELRIDLEAHSDESRDFFECRSEECPQSNKHT